MPGISATVKKHSIWKYIPVEVYFQVIVSPAWSLKPKSDFVQFSLAKSPSITRQTLLYQSPQQSNRFRIVSEINSIGSLSKHWNFKDTLTILFLTQMNTQMVHNLPLTKFGHKFEDFDHFRSLWRHLLNFWKKNDYHR